MDIHIGNFDTSVHEEELKELFAAYGEVDSLKIRKNTYTGLSRGFGYVCMPNENEALQAILCLNNLWFKNRALTVGKAKYISGLRRMS